MCLFCNILLTERPIWFSFTVKRFIGTRIVQIYFGGGHLLLSKRNRPKKTLQEIVCLSNEIPMRSLDASALSVTTTLPENLIKSFMACVALSEA